MAVPTAASSGLTKLYVSDQGLQRCRPWLFLALIVLGSYFPSYLPPARLILLSAASLIILLIFFASASFEKRAISIICLFLLMISSFNPICLSLVSALYFVYLGQRDSPVEVALSTISASLPPFIILMENLQAAGLYGGIAFIYFWGAGYIAALIVLFLILKNRLLPTVIAFMAIAVVYISIQNGLIGSTRFISDPSSPVQYNEEQIASLGKSFTAKSNLETNAPLGKENYVFLIGTKSVFDLIKSAKKESCFYLFGEHDNISKFSGFFPDFNKDDYRRKSPWVAYRPFFRYDLNIFSDKDPLYCSNLGCTLKQDLKSYPIAWEYKPNGVPILLAKGKRIGKSQTVFFGDSDPVVPFLIPYNPQFLKRLFGQYSAVYMLIVLPIAIATMMAFYLKNRASMIAQLVLVCISSFFIFYPTDSPGASDINVTTEIKIENPHYDFHVSSLVKHLVELGYAVTLNKDSELSRCEIILVGSSKKALPSEMKTIVFLLPGAKADVGGKVFEAGAFPLGSRLDDSIDGDNSSVVDARDLIAKGQTLRSSIAICGNVTIIASASPQRNAELIGKIINQNR